MAGLLGAGNLYGDQHSGGKGRFDGAHLADAARGALEVLAARSGPEALDICALHAQPILLLLTDLVMPEMDGLALARKIAELQPGIRVVYMSGYTEHAVLQRGLFGPDSMFLQKPFTPLALTNKIGEALQ
ncbi:MAG: response regulator [Bryobacteraceae bacterium]